MLKALCPEKYEVKKLLIIALYCCEMSNQPYGDPTQFVGTELPLSSWIINPAVVDVIAVTLPTT